MKMVYVLDTSVTTEILEQLKVEGARFILLQSVKDAILRHREQTLQEKVKEWEEKGVIEVKCDEAFSAEYQDDRLIQLCKTLQENEHQTVELLTNDLLVHLKAQLNGISAAPA